MLYQICFKNETLRIIDSLLLLSKGLFTMSWCYMVLYGFFWSPFRYAQRFDPGFGFNGGPYAVQPMFTPALNYNTEFPQLGSTHRPQISAECQPRPLPQHIPGQWGSSSPAGIGYGPRDTVMAPYQNHVGAHSSSALYAYSQFPCQRPGMPFIHHHEHVQQSLAQVQRCLTIYIRLMNSGYTSSVLWCNINILALLSVTDIYMIWS